jgi:Chlorophyll A-B binding protein
MKLSLALLLASAGVGSAFNPSTTNTKAKLLGMSSTEPVIDTTPAVVPINGWVPDSSKPCFGLPGAISPLGYFDPLGFCDGRELSGVKRFREAEVMHGRVAMMATVGYLIGENTPTIAYGFDTPTIANNQIPEVPGIVLFPFLAINIAEAFRANKGWVEPGVGPLFTLREKYYPGDLGFDPLGLKPGNAKDFESMQAKELSNGRLAMLAAAGMCVQEQVNGKPILETLFSLN